MKSKNGRILYDYAKTLIPGGTTLFSKDQNYICQTSGCAYFTKAKKI